MHFALGGCPQRPAAAINDVGPGRADRSFASRTARCAIRSAAPDFRPHARGTAARRAKHTTPSTPFHDGGRAGAFARRHRAAYVDERREPSDAHAARGRRNRRATARKPRYVCVPPTVSESIRTVGWPTPTGTDCPSLPQVRRPASSCEVVADHRHAREHLRAVADQRRALDRAR